MASRIKKRYKDSPTMERDDKGKMAIGKRKEADTVAAGVEGVVRDGSLGSEGSPVFQRQAIERQQMYGRHEAEHAAHDYGKGGEKNEMYDRHSGEIKSMAKRHMKEKDSGKTEESDKSLGGEKKKESGGEEKSEKTGEAKIEKTEKDQKE